MKSERSTLDNHLVTRWLRCSDPSAVKVAASQTVLAEWLEKLEPLTVTRCVFYEDFKILKIRERMLTDTICLLSWEHKAKEVKLLKLDTDSLETYRSARSRVERLQFCGYQFVISLVRDGGVLAYIHNIDGPVIEWGNENGQIEPQKKRKTVPRRKKDGRSPEELRAILTSIPFEGLTQGVVNQGLVRLLSFDGGYARLGYFYADDMFYAQANIGRIQRAFQDRFGRPMNIGITRLKYRAYPKK